MIESRDSETGLPLHIGQDIPKPGRDVGTQVPEDFIAPPSRGGHQSPPADEHVAIIAGQAMQVLSPNTDF